jgi:branched-chain amino acid transport system substrate-binding protein
MRLESGSGGWFVFPLVLILLTLVPMLGGCAGSSAVDSTSVGAPTTSGAAVTSTTSDAAGSSTTVTSATAPQVVRVGALFPLTGELAKQGAECLEGMRLAVDEVNAAGGIKSLGGVRLELTPGDSQGEPSNAEKEFTRLVKDEGAVAVVGAYQSTVAIPAGKTAEDLKTPFVVSTGAANEITDQNLAYTFRLCPKASWYARDQVSFLSESGMPPGQPVTKVVLLHEDGAFGSETAADQRAYLKEAGIEVVDEITYPADQADLSEEIVRIKSEQAQAVLTATYLNDAVLIADGALRLHLRTPIIDAGGGTTDAEFLTRAGDSADSIMTELEYCAGTSAGPLEKAYSAAGGGTLSAAALYSYQAVWLLANALERAGSTDHDRLRAALATTAMVPADHMVLPQSVLSFDGTGQNRAARLFVAQIQASKYVPIWPAEYSQASVAMP